MGENTHTRLGNQSVNVSFDDQRIIAGLLEIKSKLEDSLRSDPPVFSPIIPEPRVTVNVQVPDLPTPSVNVENQFSPVLFGKIEKLIVAHLILLSVIVTINAALIFYILKKSKNRGDK